MNKALLKKGLSNGFQHQTDVQVYVHETDNASIPTQPQIKLINAVCAHQWALFDQEALMVHLGLEDQLVQWAQMVLYLLVDRPFLVHLWHLWHLFLRGVLVLQKPSMESNGNVYSHRYDSKDQIGNMNGVKN